jgi:Putative metallopeptidase
MKTTSAVARNVTMAAANLAMLTLAMLTAAVAEPTTESGTPTESRTHQIAIAYEMPKNPAHEGLHDLLVNARVLEQVQEILSAFRLKKLLPISIESCDGEADARYVYSEARIKVCYEYIDEIWRDLPPETTAAGVTPIDAIVGPLADVFFHEFGHALIEQYRIPVLGREEYAADTISAMLMLMLAKDESRRLIMGAAYWYTDDLETTITLKPTDFASVHGTPHQRFFNLLCIAYGANQEMFGDLVEKGLLPEERAEDCKSEFQQATHAFNVLIRPHMDQPLANEVFGRRWMPDVGMQPPRLSKSGSGSKDDSTPSTN